MKRLILILALHLTLSPLFGSHFSGGEIWYEYAGTAQYPNRYDVYVIIYRDVSGVSMCPGYCPLNICVTSSCFPTMNLTASLLPFNLQPGSDTIAGSYPGSIITPNVTQCVNSNSTGLVQTEAYRFYAQVDLPGNCSDFTFAYTATARNTSSNLIFQDNLYIDAFLNNTVGPNTSLRFLSPAGKAFCLNTPIVWSQSAIEPDGDSVFYNFGTPYGGSSCGNPTTITFTAGYSAYSPITTANGINFDHKSGILSFTPSQIEIVVIKIQAREYRYDTTFGVWLFIGQNTRDVQIPVVSNNDCKAPPSSWFNLQPDTVVAVQELKCSDSIVVVNFEEDVITSSIAPDGTDFSLINSQGNILPIVGASYAGSYHQTSKVELYLRKAIYYNDTLLLSVRTGSDLNTLETACSHYIPEGDSLVVKVSDCSTSITLNEAVFQKISIFPNPANDFLQLESVASIHSGKILVTDLMGKVNIDHSFESIPSKLNISQLSTGLYFLTIANHEFNQTLLFEKQ